MQRNIILLAAALTIGFLVGICAVKLRTYKSTPELWISELIAVDLTKVSVLQIRGTHDVGIRCSEQIWEKLKANPTDFNVQLTAVDPWMRSYWR